MTDNLFDEKNMNSHGLMQKALEIQNRNKEKQEMSNISEKKNNKNTAIVLRDGIFTISENLETSSVEQDPELKKLIDSVLK